MNNESRFLEYLLNLEKTVSSLEKFDTSVETQISIFHLRSLVMVTNPAGLSGTGATSSSFKDEDQIRLRILKTLSDLGTRSLFTTEKEESINVQDR